jgi:cytochrome c biogenesis protein CcmG, thiol:disulfide interchange protein DsbE
VAVRHRILIGLGFLAITAGLVALGAFEVQSADGSKAPALPSERVAGPTVTLASLRGEPAAINFWASWCTPCRREAGELERLSLSKDSPGSVVGVNWNDELSAARGFVRDYHLTFPNLRDPDGAVGQAYGIIGLPTTVILDSRGQIASVLDGPQTVATLRAALDSADLR